MSLYFRWRFEAVRICPEYPDGGRAFYRDYITDEVVLFKVVDKLSASSRIGQLIGLECSMHFSEWYPKLGTFDNRPDTDGMSLLVKIPNLERGRQVPVCSFTSDCEETFEKVFSAMRSKWLPSNEHRKFFFFVLYILFDLFLGRHLVATVEGRTLSDRL